MTKPALPNDNRHSQQPPRSYEVPGGPQAKNLGKIEVKVLAEIVRGGDEDRAGNRGR